ncbi:ATP-dependent Clp protease proteolytic subunit, partial [Patescibacteria group bacterium]|nr:ATP-dependent Clp protease proteolytic subunit [Patescibacteria group bacterium]
MGKRKQKKSRKAERVAVIYLNQELTNEAKKVFLSELDEFFCSGAKIDRIRIIIDSPGGSIKNALAMWDRLER